MACSRPAIVRVLVALVALPLVACGGDLNVPNPATLAARANATARGGAVIPATVQTAATPTTLTLTLGIPTASAGGAMTRTAGTPSPRSGTVTRPAGPTTGTRAAMGGTVPYTDPLNRFSFMRPENWQETKQVDQDVVVLFVSASPQGVVNVRATQVPPGMTLDQYYTTTITDLKARVAGYQEGPAGMKRGQLGGEPVWQVDYYATPSDTKSYFVQWYCIYQGIAYQLTVDTFVDPTSDDVDAFQRSAQVVADSWKFL